ncbi:MAG: hypothetical protein K2L36_06265 [Eubacterium sp.]|nr:hypothetical protein [Eubacterium sp.]
MKKIVCILLTLITITAVFAGCGSKTEYMDMIYPFGGNINSYDPQVASTADEFLLIENCYEGLVRCDDDGNIIPGCAESWEISENGLKYTFHLQKNLRWYIYDKVAKRMGEKYNPEITAFDFAFALQRAVDPNTDCPLYSTISVIENAPKINAGQLDKSELGVNAIDNYTLEIWLSSPDSTFLQTLSTAVAMPCNEEFFDKTNGRYGLNWQYTLFNGQFAVTSVLDTSYVLKKNKSYNGPSPAKATDLTFKIVDEDTSLADQIKSGYYDAAYIRGYESTEISEKSGIALLPYSNTTWTLVMNTNSGILSAGNARHAIALSLSDIDLEKYPYLTKAKGFIPPSCKTENASYTDNSFDVTEQSDSSKAVSLWKTAVEATSTYTIDLTVLAPKNMEDIAKQLLQGIQSSIGSISNAEEDKKIDFSLKLETLTESELKAAVNSGEYDIALYPLTATASSPVSFLQLFTDSNITGFDTSEFNSSLQNAQSADAANTAAACRICEEKLIASHCYVPLFYESSYYASAKGVTGVQFHPGSGRVSFVSAERK